MRSRWTHLVSKHLFSIVFPKKMFTGFLLRSRSCYSGVNVCAHDNGGCSHLCLRSPGGYTCACPTGILMRPDGRTCEDGPQAFLLFASQSGLNWISLDTPDNTNVVIPISDIHGVVAVDYHQSERKIYYTDSTLGVIRYDSNLWYGKDFFCYHLYI